EVMATPAREFWLKKAGCIKIDRSISDMVAIRNCVTVCQQGNLLGMFPEGRIQTDSNTDAVKSGAILIALQSSAPILPLYSQKPNKWWQRRLVVMGEPFYPAEQCAKKFPSMQDIQQLSAQLQTKIEECKKAYESHH
ncbi:MAG: 1-acyl-sn-glycerol-3-phosphate acyltransferase, partial [Clostridia bacterium]|nr:1-acyl-sn-glycerol-3-phosphate acyltransferase [Clostridia bacterium]